MTIENISSVRYFVTVIANNLDGTPSERMKQAWKFVKAMRTISADENAADVALLKTGFCPSCLASGYLLEGADHIHCLNCGEVYLKIW